MRNSIDFSQSMKYYASGDSAKDNVTGNDWDTNIRMQEGFDKKR